MDDKTKLPHGLTPADLRELEELEGNIQVGPDITTDEYFALVRWILRRRRGSGAAGLTSSLVLSPSVPSVPTGSPPGTVVGTLSVINGLGTYTYSFLSNPGGYFTIVGNQIQLALTAPSPQTIPVQILADNGLGDKPTLSTNIVIIAAGYTTTWPYYGF